MLTPNMGNRPNLIGIAWGADTGCFSPSGDRGFDLRVYLDWLASMNAYRDTCLFATAPDVMQNAVATWARSEAVLPLIRAAGYPATLVAQDGIENMTVQWDAFDVLFIGGSTRWKLSPAVSALVAAAKQQGKWVHMGRVNSARRLRASELMGCDSADGTFIKFAPDMNGPKVLDWLDQIERAPLLFRTA